MLFAMVSLLPSVNLHPDGALGFSLLGTAHGTDGRAHAATLWIRCSGTASVGIELDISARAPEDLATFRGPAGSTQENRLSRLGWTTAAAISVPVSTWRPRESLTYLQLNVREAETPSGLLLGFLRAIKGGGTLEWRAAFDDTGDMLSAVFAVTDKLGVSLQQSIGQCLNPRVNLYPWFTPY